MNNNIKKLIDIAINEIGYLEKNSPCNLDCKSCNAGSNNYTKYARDCFSELQGLSWCCMFVWWCFEKAFGKITTHNIIGEKTAKCSIMKDRMLSVGCKIVDRPEVGDIVFFSGGNEINHLGIVQSIGSDYFSTIEGNTRRGIDDVVSNGGGVFSRAYQYNNIRIDSFIRPLWDLLNNSKDVENEIQIYNAEIKATNVNIRSGPGTEYRVIGMETKGFRFYKINEDFDGSGKKWYNFRYKNQNAYIRSDFIKLI